MTKVTVKSKRNYSAHHALLRAADNYLLAAENEERFCSDGQFVSLVMASLAVESLCNTVGEVIFEDWELDFERASPRAKIRIICQQLGIAYDKNKEPFITLHWLNGFRNKIAHAKPESLREEVELAKDDYEKLSTGNGPQSKLERQITVDSAKRSLKALSDFQELVIAEIPEDKRYLLEDFWESSISEMPQSEHQDTADMPSPVQSIRLII